MSYILDALRRADAERERGGVPGLHSQAAGAARDDDQAPRSAAPPWAWIAIGLAAGLAIVLVWLMLGRSGAPDPVLAAAPSLPVTPLPAPAPPPPPPVQAAPAAAVPPPVQAPAATPPPVRTPQRAVDILPRVAPPVSPAPAVTKPPTPPAPATKAAAAAPVTTKVATVAAGEAAASEPRVLALRELPDEVRRALPSLTIGGAMFSQNAASRFLMINGQLFHENDALTPELTLRQIKLKSAVLEFRDYRYEVNY